MISTSSGNLDNYMAERRYNDAYTMVDDAEGYQAGVANFDQMLSDSYHNAAAPTATGNGVTYHFFPRRRANLFGSIMNKVRCQGATGGTGIDGRTAIRMTTSLWDRSRLDVARQVVGLRRHGCNIYVIAQSYNIDRGILRMFRAAKVRFRFADTPRTALGNHSKYVTVSGNFNGRTNSTTVYSGSLNLTASDNSACDNNMIRITDVSAHDRLPGTLRCPVGQERPGDQCTGRGRADVRRRPRDGGQGRRALMREVPAYVAGCAPYVVIGPARSRRRRRRRPRPARRPRAAPSPAPVVAG